MARGNRGGARPAFGSAARKAQQRAAYASLGVTDDVLGGVLVDDLLGGTLIIEDIK